MTDKALVDALSAWRRALGADRVADDPSLPSHLHRGAFGRAFRISAVVSPRTREEVQATLRIASDAGQRVHAASGGKNWGFGARQSAPSPSVLIEFFPR